MSSSNDVEEGAPLLSGDAQNTTDLASTAFGNADAPPGSSSRQEQPKGPVAGEEKTPSWRIMLGGAYMLAMGVCGIVLTAIGSMLDQLAENCGTTALEVATVFLARGAGAIVGSLASGKFYSWFHGNYVLVLALIWVATMLMLLAFVTEVWYLHVLFAGLGFGTSVTDTGCQIMTRKAHGKHAGPWLGSNTVTFGIAGALVPLMELVTSSLLLQLSILAGVALLTAALIVMVPVPAYLGQSMDKKLGKAVRSAASGATGYWVEINLSAAVFCLIGGKVAFSSYVEDYIDDTSAIPSHLAGWGLAVLWIAITLGRLGGLRDQMTVESKADLYRHLYLWLLTGGFGCALMLLFPSNEICAWLGIFLYGFGNGPCVGYCYDINNRITIPSEFGMSIVMFGLNFGASIVPYLTALVWDDTGHAYWLTLVTFLTMVFPLGFVRMTKVFQKEEIGFLYAAGEVVDTPAVADKDASE